MKGRVNGDSQKTSFRMNMLERVKHKDVLILVAAWMLLYLPYILFGGLVRDDLGLLLTDPSAFKNYFDFQWYMSTNINMTARPVSAILHGVCNWHFGVVAWRYHLVNLALFGGSILFFYLTLRELISRDVALLSALFALVYPCASGTIFSATMMNSNLSAIFWSSASYLLTKDVRGKYVFTALLLGLSSLSYEAFIPLFIFNAVIVLLVMKPGGQGRRRLLFDSLPVFAAIAFYALYRGGIEKIIFHTQFSRIMLISPLDALARFFMSIILGFEIALVESFKISWHALNNLDLVSIQYLLIVISGLVLLGIYLSRRNTDSESPGYIRKFASQYDIFQIKKIITWIFALPHLCYFAAPILFMPFPGTNPTHLALKTEPWAGFDSLPPCPLRLSSKRWIVFCRKYHRRKC